ncbi:F0F1 ATP synthase subunit epsilon [Desulforudis sp. 1088]|uniref:F0F1 ATP synthase subunit epsilon n=1 Tax=unclassified Candidatus Desulforudis TaxID=2635950 RepID=UPI00347678EC
MADKTSKVSIVTPERVIYSDEARLVIARGTDGELGILPEHAPLITSLEIGALRLQKDGHWKTLAVSGGFMEVKDSRIVVLANAAELPEQIDVERARRAKERAEQRLASKAQEVDLLRAEAALKRALLRLRVAEQGDKYH